MDEGCHKASVVKSLTSSRCTAFVQKQMNTARYDFRNTGFLVCPALVMKGPA